MKDVPHPATGFRQERVFRGLIARLDEVLERGFDIVQRGCTCSECAGMRSMLEDDFTLTYDAAKLIAQAWKQMFADDPVFHPGDLLGGQDALDERWGRFEYMCIRFDNISVVGTAHNTTKEIRS